ICLGVDLEPSEWIKDSGCSKHMAGNRKLFSSYKAYNGGNVIFGSNIRGNIIGKGQICDNKCKVTFSEHDSEITKDSKVIGRGIKNKGLYVMKLGNKPEDKICLTTINENSTLRHRRLGHANMRLIQSLVLGIKLSALSTAKSKVSIAHKLQLRNYQEESFTHKEEMAPMASSDSEVHNDKPCTKSCLKNYETLKKQYDDLLAKLHESEFKAAN
ncbi:hypothetical protein Tco_1097420, partial [Tanacetum coccineum]